MVEEPLPIFRRVLGDAFDRLPAPIRQMHDIVGQSVAEGLAEVTRGGSPLTGAIGWLAGLPSAGARVPVTVVFTPRRGAERWRRSFGPSSFETVLAPCESRAGHLVERLGPMAFLLQIAADPDGLTMFLRRMTVLGVPMPRLLWPRLSAKERVADGLLEFDVSISAPIGGLIIRYRGVLQPVRPGAD